MIVHGLCMSSACTHVHMPKPTPMHMHHVPRSPYVLPARCPVAIIEESQPLEVAKRLVQQGKRVTIRDRGFIVCLVRRTYGNLFDYEIEDAGTSDSGQAAEPARPNVDMGNPSSSYRR